MVAQTLEGKAASEFIQASAFITQGNLLTLVNGSDASALHNHDSSYVKLGAAAAQNLGSGTVYTTGQVGIGVVAPTAGVDYTLKIRRQSRQ